MAYYLAVERGGAEREIRVQGATIEEAAQHAVNRLASRVAEAHRTTGERGEPGIFQGYRPYGDGMTSTGQNILLTPKRAEKERR